MDEGGDFYVLEVNPLPGLTPDYSDLCLIAKAANIDYRSLIGEILAGGLKRLREKRRAEAREAEAARVGPGSNGNGESNGKAENNGRGEKPVAEKTPTVVPQTP
jgi:D-alanine-D-alanine ligase